MPMSWVKAQTATSSRLRACMGDDRSKQRFEECVTSVVASSGGEVRDVWFEQNTKWAHIRFYWDTIEQKRAIVYDLEGEDLGDLLTAVEADELIAFRQPESS
jgi:hypothetical protein